MIGAIIGDIAGSRFEFENHKSKEFDLFDHHNRPTDDSVMSLAIAGAILECNGDYTALDRAAAASMQKMGRTYRNAGYGRSFYKWIFSKDPQPYHSYGNGSAMRVGPCGYAAASLEEVKLLSQKVCLLQNINAESCRAKM